MWSIDNGVALNAQGDPAAVVLTPNVCVCCGVGIREDPQDPAVCLNAVRDRCTGIHNCSYTSPGLFSN